MPLEHLLIFGFVLFAIGAAGVLARRNLLIVMMSIELMLNAVNLVFIAFAHTLADNGGHVMVMMIFVVAAVEIAIGMAIVVNMYRQRRTIGADGFRLMRG
jgi:NADH-quinone oxidoreductase subunit K